MGIFDKFKNKGNNVNSEQEKIEVYNANPHFYSKPTGEAFGSFALAEDVETALPLNPRELYKVDGKEVNEWNLCLVSVTKDEVIGTLEYYDAINKLRKYSIFENNGYLITKPLTLEEQLELLNN